MWIIIVVAALIFAAIHDHLSAELRYVPAMALFGIPVAIAALCIALASDAGTILTTIGASYGIFLVIIGLWVTAARALRRRRAA